MGGLKKHQNPMICGFKKTYFWVGKGLPTPCPHQILLHVSMAKSPTKIVFSGVFKQKFTMCSYIVRIEHVWCCRKA
jgi:hypothetical protein